MATCLVIIQDRVKSIRYFMYALFFLLQNATNTTKLSLAGGDNVTQWKVSDNGRTCMKSKIQD